MYNVFYMVNGEVYKWLDKPVSRSVAMKKADEFDDKVFPVRARSSHPVSRSWIGADV